jgi:sialate O-acetylesterase
VTIKAPITAPAIVRYAWKDNPLGANAYSLDGLPLSPFELRLK